MNRTLEQATGRRLAKRDHLSFFDHLLAIRPALTTQSGIGSPETFERFAIENFQRSSAQFLQDLWVLHELGEQRDGFFVEFGAMDGRQDSNSLLLETDYGWRGILAEPNEQWRDLIKARRPNASVDTRCVWVETGKEIEFMSTTARGLSTVARYALTDKHAVDRVEEKRYSVPTVSLADLLDEHDAPPVIDFLSIDTEGSEFDILSAYGFPGNRLIRCIAVEHNQSPARQQIYDLLVSKGYRQRFPEASFDDDWFLHTG